MKSLDKKKPIFDIIDDIREEKTKMSDKKKPKELESWQIDKKSQERQDKVGLEFADKVVEKFKPKELDWEKEVDGISFDWLNDHLTASDVQVRVKNIILNLLTQQRTELLEEIIKLSDKIELEGNTKFEEWKAFKRFRNTLRDKNINLLNKKDE